MGVEPRLLDGVGGAFLAGAVILFIEMNASSRICDSQKTPICL
jgi:hypothetical protein